MTEENGDRSERLLGGWQAGASGARGDPAGVGRGDEAEEGTQGARIAGGRQLSRRPSRRSGHVQEGPQPISGMSAYSCVILLLYIHPFEILSHSWPKAAFSLAQPLHDQHRERFIVVKFMLNSDG